MPCFTSVGFAIQVLPLQHPTWPHHDNRSRESGDPLLHRITSVLVATLDDLIRMKTAAGRAKDRAEVEILSALRDERDEA